MALKFVKRMYYQGKVVAYFKKNSSVLRYKLLSIEERYLTSLNRVKPSYPLANADKLNKEIDDLEEKIDKAVEKILYDNPKAKITNAVIDEALAQTPKVDDSEESNENDDYTDNLAMEIGDNFDCRILNFIGNNRSFIAFSLDLCEHILNACVGCGFIFGIAFIVLLENLKALFARCLICSFGYAEINESFYSVTDERTDFIKIS